MQGQLPPRTLLSKYFLPLCQARAQLCQLAAVGTLCPWELQIK